MIPQGEMNKHLMIINSGGLSTSTHRIGVDIVPKMLKCRKPLLEFRSFYGLGVGINRLS